ncbi:MAG: glycosyltransferase family A protein [Candidatus Nanopelagicales bacterium]
MSNPLSIDKGQGRKIRRGPVPGLPEGVTIKLRANSWLVKSKDVQGLQQLAVMVVGGPPITRIDVRLKSWTPPKGWSGTHQLGGLTSVWLHGFGDGILLELVAAEKTDPGLLLAGAARMLAPTPTLGIGPMLSFAPGLPASAAALVGDLHDIVLPTDRAHVHLRRCDTLIASSEVSVDSIERTRTVIIDEDRPTWVVGGVEHEVYVNPLVHRPVGRRSTGSQAIAIGSVQAGELVIEGPGVHIRTVEDLSGLDVQSLLEVGAVQGSVELPARWRAQLEACGLILGTGGFPTDDLAWQVESVRTRRHALRAHTPAAALDAWPTVSVVLATHRDRFIDHAVQQLARLRYPNLQVVIGLHGIDVDPARFAAIGHETVVKRIDADVPFGSALQQLSQRAEGEVITKMDDDDFYGPEHIWDLVIARMYSGAALVGKALDWIHVESVNTTAFRPEFAAESYEPFVAGGTMMISRADLDAVGGWRPVPKSVDRAMIDRVRAAGGAIYRTHGLGYLYERRGEGHTATPNEEHFLTKTAKTYEGRIEHEVFGTGA